MWKECDLIVIPLSHMAQNLTLKALYRKTILTLEMMMMMMTAES